MVSPDEAAAAEEEAARIKEEEEDEERYLLDPSQKLVCRFYENQYPAIEEVVMVNVRTIAEMGAYVTLMEYDNIEGMILLSELSRRRIRSVNKLIRVNRNEVVMVLRVDREKGYIDLSKRRVDPDSIAKCEDRYNKAKAVHRVLRQVAEKEGLVLKHLYKKIGWPLYKKYGHAYDAFKLCLTDQEDIFKDLPDLDPKVVATLTDYIKKRLAPQPIKIRADVEVTCFTYEGIDAVKESLLAGAAHGTKDCPIKIKLIAPPMYVITTATLDKDLGIEMLTKAIEIITEKIISKGGKIDVKLAPKAVSQREEAELAAMMERLAAEAEEEEDEEEGEEGDADLA